MEFMSTGELILLGTLTLMSLIMITFPEEAKFPFVGAFVLSMIMVIAYTTHSIHLDKEFVLKRFQESQAIECGLWRGERTLIHSKSGWTYQSNIGFIKEDRIHNDLGWCNVIGEESPEPSTVPYTFALIIELILCFGLRTIVQTQLNEEEDHDESDPE